jgi:hypothetical protein
VSIRSSRFGANDPSIKPVEANILPAIATERHPNLFTRPLTIGPEIYIWLDKGNHSYKYTIYYVYNIGKYKIYLYEL